MFLYFDTWSCAQKMLFYVYNKVTMLNWLFCVSDTIQKINICDPFPLPKNPKYMSHFSCLKLQGAHYLALGWRLSQTIRLLMKTRQISIIPFSISLLLVVMIHLKTEQNNVYVFEKKKTKHESKIYKCANNRMKKTHVLYF